MVSPLLLTLCFALPLLTHSQYTYDASYDNPAAQVDPNKYLHPQSHHELMHFLKKERHLFSPRVTSIMSSLTRHHYVSERSRATGISYSDQPLYIGFEATIGSPQMHAGCLEQLAHLCPIGGHYLEIGTGSGYMTAAIAMLTGEQGHVTAIDLMDGLITYARNAITKDHPELLSRITFHVGNGHDGFPQAAPFDCIYSGAYFDHVPAALVAQLKPGGSMLIPLSRTGSLIWTVITKKSDSTIDHKRYDHIDSGIYGGIERAVHPDDMELMEYAHVDVDEFIRGPPETLSDHQPPTHTPPMEQTSA